MADIDGEIVGLLSGKECIVRHFYMIRNKHGFFSSGGIDPKFSRSGGKVWNKRSHVLTHLRMLGSEIDKYYLGCEVVDVVVNLTSGEGKRTFKPIGQLVALDRL